MEDAPPELEIRRKRIKIRAWRRGMLETDLLLGRFADAEVETLGEAEIDAFEALLEAKDHDVFAWASGEAPIPPEHDTPLFARILAHQRRLFLPDAS